MSPRISFLIINFNYAEWLCDAIESAAVQNYDNYDIIFVDDASTDDSWKKFMSKYVKHGYSSNTPEGIHVVGEFNKIKIHGIRLNVNGGPSRARNIGINFALDKSVAVCPLDSDDIVYPNKLKCLAEVLFSNPEVGVAYDNYYINNLMTGITVHEIKETFSYEKLLRSCIVHGSCLIKLNYLEAVKNERGYYDQTMRVCEDWDLWIRLAQKCILMQVPVTETLHRATPRSSTDTVSKEIWQNGWSTIYERYCH